MLSVFKRKPEDMEAPYAHKDIAFEFGMWISAEFKIYLVREFQRLKEQELAPTGLECQARTVENKLPHPHRCYQTKPYPGRSHTTTSFPHLRQRSRCAERCHVRPHCPRMARCASRPERKRPRLCHGERIDLSSNMENLNAVFIGEGLPQHERLVRLNRIAIQQMQILEDVNKKYLK